MMASGRFDADDGRSSHLAGRPVQRQEAASRPVGRRPLLRGLVLDDDVLRWRGWERVEKFGWQSLACLRILQADDPAGALVAFDQARRRPLDADVILVPAGEAESRDIDCAIVVAIHRYQATPTTK